MPFKGSLKRNVLVQITVHGSATNPGPTATTLQKVIRVPQLQKSELFELDLLSTPAGTNTVITPMFGNNVTRIVLAVYPPTGGSSIVKVAQAGVVNDEEIIVGDGQVVYDLVA